MKYVKIIREEDHDNINISLSKQEIKMLINLIADTINEFPEMTGYKEINKKLLQKINS